MLPPIDMLEHSTSLHSMNELTIERRAAVVRALAEGNSICATVRMTGAAKATVTKLLVDLGTACAEYQRTALVNLPCKRIQCDEIWAFVAKKEKNVALELRGQGVGDVWTWTALCAETKLALSWYVGRRYVEAAAEFMEDVASRVAGCIQLTTDGLLLYRPAVEKAFGWNGVDYAMLVKEYAATTRAGQYSPGECIGAKPEAVMGNPDPKHVSTSFTERANLTMRMHMRRFTRLTNGFSKKIENHAHAVALHFMYYNFVKSHTTLTKARKAVHTTPAMDAGVTDKVWKVEDLIALLSN